MARRTPAMVTRQSAEDIASLTAEARISPTVLAALIGVPASIITHLFVKNIRMPVKQTREATSILKKVIELRKSNPRLVVSNVASIRKALAEEPQADFMAIKDAYFSADKGRNYGTVSVTLENGRVFEFENIKRSEFFRWEQNDFRYDFAPNGVVIGAL